MKKNYYAISEAASILHVPVKIVTDLVKDRAFKKVRGKGIPADEVNSVDSILKTSASPNRR